jgi:hypothetical protein
VRPEIYLRVTEGFAGVDYAVVLDGSAGILVGGECVSFCDFQAGEVIRTLSPDQVSYLAGLFLDAGIHGLDGTDFGRECCDQLHFEVEYRDEAGASKIQGSSEALPDGLHAAVAALHGLLSGRSPLVVDFETSPDRWPADPLQILEGEISGDFLHLRVSYTGGCRIHDIKGVAWGGWMESFPVQTRVFLSHDDRNDACDAVVTEDLRFDLRPLRDAYVDSYGPADPGTTTVVFEVTGTEPPYSSMLWFFEYVF